MQVTTESTHRASRASTPICSASLAFAAALALVSSAQAQTAGWFIARHDPSGQLDTDFNDGQVLTGELDDPTSSDVLEDLQESPFGEGQIIVGGAFKSTGSAKWQMILARYTKEGVLDSFGFGGVSSAKFRDKGSEGIDAVGFQRSRQIVVAGASHTPGSYEPFVGRFSWDGVRDLSFGDSNGWQNNLVSSSPTYVMALKVLADDSIIVLINFESQIALIKLRPNGITDKSFGQANGTLFQPCGKNCWPTNMAIDRAGGILVTGNREKAGSSSSGASFPPEGFIMKFTPNGKLDTGWGGGGSRVIPGAAGSAGVAVDMAGSIPTDNIIVLSQMTDGKVGLQRISSRGDVEAGFVRTFNFQGQSGQWPVDVRVRGNKIRLTATTRKTTNNGAVHTSIGVASVVLSSFAMDSSFGTSGRTVTNLPFKSSSPHGFNLDLAGNLLTCGQINGDQ